MTKSSILIPFWAHSPLLDMTHYKGHIVVWEKNPSMYCFAGLIGGVFLSLSSHRTSTYWGSDHTSASSDATWVAQNCMTMVITLFSMMPVHINAIQHCKILEKGPLRPWCDSSMILAQKDIKKPHPKRNQVTVKLHYIITLKIRSKSDCSSVNLALAM